MANQSRRNHTSFGFTRVAFAFALLVSMALIGYLIMASGADRDMEKVQIVRNGSTIAQFDVEMMITQEQRSKGLSGRKSLPAGQGMLFLFPYAANYSMWMYEMNFPIDFIFFNNERIAVHIVENEPPCVPGASCPSIYPGRAIRYILEVPAGTVSSYGIRLGDQLQLPEPIPESEPDSLPPVY